MNVDRGLIRLQRYLPNNGKEAARAVTDLGAKLRTQVQACDANIESISLKDEYLSIVDSLDKLAYRNAGMSFAELCREPRHGNHRASLSLPLSGVLILLISGLLCLGLGVALASSQVQGTGSPQMGELRKQVMKIDDLIGKRVASTFYLSRVSPCDDAALQNTGVGTNLSVSIQPSATEPDACTWVYRDLETGRLVAEDHWEWKWSLQPVLRQRDYYDDDAVIARDVFDSQESECFRRREYDFPEETEEFDRECYSEAGKLRSIKSSSVLSPIPPMAYWFFYR